MLLDFTPSDIARFWSKVAIRGEDECWPWLGSIHPRGYGRFGFHGQIIPAYRASWVVAHGPIPVGLQVLHTCENRYPPGDFSHRRCVNHAHLYLGTNADNRIDSVVAGRVAHGERHGSILHPELVARGENHGLRKHPERIARGENHGNARLTAADILAIRSTQGAETLLTLARKYGVSQEHISNIIRRKKWTHI